MKYGSVEWGEADDHIHDTINRDYYISCRSSCGGVNNMELTLNELLEWQKENKRIPAIFNSTDHECQVVIDDKLRYAFSGRFNENTKFDVIVNNKETYYVVERFDRYVDGVYSFFASEEPYEKTVSTTKSLLDCYRYDTYEEAKEFADKYDCKVRKVIVKVEG